MESASVNGASVSVTRNLEYFSKLLNHNSKLQVWFYTELRLLISASVKGASVSVTRKLEYFSKLLNRKSKLQVLILHGTYTTYEIFLIPLRIYKYSSYTELRLLIEIFESHFKVASIHLTPNLDYSLNFLNHNSKLQVWTYTVYFRLNAKFFTLLNAKIDIESWIKLQ